MEFITSFFEFFLGNSSFEPAFDDSIFRLAFLLTLIIPIGMAAVFYLVVNGTSKFAAMRKSSHWFLFLFLSTILTTGLVIAITINQIGGFIPYTLGLATLVAVVSAFFYLIGSLLFKGKSLHARYIPFRFLLIK